MLKIKNKISITKKLFVFTAFIFITFISSTLIIQSLFFEKFYVNKKLKFLKTEVTGFRQSFNAISAQDQKIIFMNNFEERTNSKVIILDTFGNLKLIRKSDSVSLDNAKVRTVQEVIKEWIRSSTNPFDKGNKDKVLTYITNDREFEMKTIVCALTNSSSDEVIFLVSSLQPVNEAVEVIKEIYFYFYIVAILLIVILSFAYSNTITKPLVEINQTASKMAQLDFSEKCIVRSEDEIGNLASSLNFLSENLDKALTSLKAANAKLEEDIIKERNMERMRKEFVAAVSHELKTPITLIEGYAEGLKDEIFEGEDRDYYIDVIMDESRKMGSLVKDMLDLSQLESGNFKLIKEEFEIEELVQNVWRRLKGIIGDKNITINKNLIKGIMINGDWGRLEQVLTNFLTNAIRHVDDRGIININMKVEGEKVFIEVENSGEFIEEEELNKIWDKFYKIDKSRSRKVGGTGLGLAIVKNIIVLHDGVYGVENTNIGVKFYFGLNIVN